VKDTLPGSLNRRSFLSTVAVGAAFGLGTQQSHGQTRGEGLDSMNRKPNLVFVFADQWRAQALGYMGDPNVKTPHIDKLATKSLNFTNTVAGMPVCCPYRASLITGQYWLTHGHFMNDLHLPHRVPSIADAFKEGGYDTAYIGKWHLDGKGRSSFIPRERRQGFEFWKVLECTHNYNNSHYYGDTPERKTWDGYDAIAQTREAQKYMREHSQDKPFFLVLSWGPPHDPYHTAPQEYRDLYDPEKLTLPPNVPKESETVARDVLSCYYAHCTVLDDCVGLLMETLEENGLSENTIFIFTSDHGDMLGSHGQLKKQQPWEESIMVPMLIHYPAVFGHSGKEIDTLINTPDLMPTMLGLCGVDIPDTVEGRNHAPELLRGDIPQVDAALTMCPAPFGEWQRANGGREYRGLRTKQYSYVRDLNGPWLLYDIKKDPYQMDNLVNTPDFTEVQAELDRLLQSMLDAHNDTFMHGDELLASWGYEVDETGTIPYEP